MKRSATQALESIWPQERDLMIRPDRLKYVRKLVKPKGCVFCLAKKMGPSASSLLLFQGKHAMVILNKYPYNNGHILILPTRHCGDFLELSKEELVELQILLQKTVQILTRVYGPKGFNVGLNLGEAAGAGIPEHLHYHVIPRWWGDTNFFPLIAGTKVVVEKLEMTFAKLEKEFRKLESKSSKGRKK